MLWVINQAFVKSVFPQKKKQTIIYFYNSLIYKNHWSGVQNLDLRD